MNNQEFNKIKQNLYAALDTVTNSAYVLDSKDPGKEIDIELDTIEILKKTITEIHKLIERNKEIYD